MKYSSLSVVLLSIVMISLQCGPKLSSPETRPSGTDGKITLDDNSATLSAFSIQAKSGATLTIDSGTTVLMLDTAGTAQPVSSGKTVIIALDDGDASAQVDITGIVMVALFRISATVGGNAAELEFVPGQSGAFTGMPVTGARWSATLTDTALHTGTRINLYKISGSTYALIGSQCNGVPNEGLSKKSAGGDQQTSVSPNGTGDFQAGADNGTASSGQQATMPSSGVYWNTYSNMPDTSYDVNGVTYGGPLAVQRCYVDEQSTGESVAIFIFSPGVTCLTKTGPDGDQYWCELTQGPDGSTKAIKIAATVANIFPLDLDLVRASDLHPISSQFALPDIDGVNAPDGSVLNDPYANSSLKFGGTKHFTCLTKSYDKAQKIWGKVRDAGYEVSSAQFLKTCCIFDVATTLDGRKKIWETCLQHDGWMQITGRSATWRNVGLYDQNDTLYINISSHGSGDKVNQMVQTVSGTFTDANNDPDTVQRMNVAWTALGLMDSVPATLSDGGTSFSVACSLFTGDNMFIFQPYVNDLNGRLTYQMHTVVKAKGIRAPLFTLNYKERRTGTLIVHAKTTTYTKEPDSSIAVDDITTTASLTMTPEQVVLNSIKNSQSSASTCASNLTCSILSGVSDSDQTVTVTEQYLIRSHWDCEHDKAITDMGHWNGNMTFNHYGMARVFATLLPPGTGSTRNYSLTVNIAATMDMMSTPNKAGKGQDWSCADSVWKDASIDIWPHVSLTKDDDPVVLQFGNSATLEDYVAAPTGSASWSFHGTKYSADSMSVTEYDATLSVSP
jgi:hypothetical protein